MKEKPRYGKRLVLVPGLVIADFAVVSLDLNRLLKGSLLGLTKVSFRDYFLASCVGMLPGTLIYVYLGSLAGDLALLGQAGQTRSPVEWTLYVVGLLATLAVTVYITRIARRALDRRIVQES